MDRGRAVGRHQEGISAREIARRLGVSDSVIRRLLEQTSLEAMQDRNITGSHARYKHHWKSCKIQTSLEAMQDANITGSHGRYRHHW